MLCCKVPWGAVIDLGGENFSAVTPALGTAPAACAPNWKCWCPSEGTGEMENSPKPQDIDAAWLKAQAGSAVLPTFPR